MSKQRGYRANTMIIDEAIPETVIPEDFMNVPVEEDVIEEEKTEEIKPAIYTVNKAGTVTNCFRLNIRKEPSVDAEILKVISKGDDVEIDDESTPDGWIAVILSDGTKGYTMTEYINY